MLLVLHICLCSGLAEEDAQLAARAFWLAPLAVKPHRPGRHATMRGSSARMDTCHVAPLTFFAPLTPRMPHTPCPQDLAGGDDLEAELLPDGDVQLSTRGLADLLGVSSSLLTTGNSSGSSSNGSALTAGSSSGSSANGRSREAAAAGSGGSGGSSSALAPLARQGSGTASSDLALPLAGGGGDAAAAGAQLLQRGTQCIAAYAASGGAEGASAAAHERPSLVLRRQKRQEGPGPAELLAALQQQTALVSRAAECWSESCCAVGVKDLQHGTERLARGTETFLHGRHLHILLPTSVPPLPLAPPADRHAAGPESLDFGDGGRAGASAERADGLQPAAIWHGEALRLAPGATRGRHVPVDAGKDCWASPCSRLGL